VDSNPQPEDPIYLMLVDRWSNFEHKTEDRLLPAHETFRILKKWRRLKWGTGFGLEKNDTEDSRRLISEEISGPDNEVLRVARYESRRGEDGS
jgi:hypothetical protein